MSVMAPFMVLAFLCFVLLMAFLPAIVLTAAGLGDFLMLFVACEVVGVAVRLSS